LFNKNTCLLVGPEDMSSSMLDKNTGPLVQQEDMSSCSTRTHVFLSNRRTGILVEQEYISSCWTRRHGLCSTSIHVLLLKTKTCLLVEQEDMSSCGTRGHALLCSKHPISIQEHPGGSQETPRRRPGGIQEARGVSICIVFSKSDASDHFRTDGSDMTITVYRACAQEFANVGDQNRRYSDT